MLASVYSVTILTDTPSLIPQFLKISMTEIVVTVPEALLKNRKVPG
jgi:hypothetical protein